VLLEVAAKECTVHVLYLLKGLLGDGREHLATAEKVWREADAICLRSCDKQRRDSIILPDGVLRLCYAREPNSQNLSFPGVFDDESLDYSVFNFKK